MMDALSTRQNARRLSPGSVERTTLHQAFWLGMWFALTKLLLHTISNAWGAHLGYGFHRDELYYLICGRHLAWGYVDQAPLVAVQACLAEILFGHSITGVRMLSALAGAGHVLLTGLLTWQLGGRRAAQALAMSCVLLAPEYIGLDSFLSMNSFEPTFWLLFVMLLLHMQAGASPRWWLLVGLDAGFGMLNKPSMAFFLAAMIAALLLTRERRLLCNRWFTLAALLTFLLVAPYLLWQSHHDWATWRYLRIDKASGKYFDFSVGDLLAAPLWKLLPLALPVWTGGLAYLLYRQATRWIGLGFVAFFALMAVLGAKEYYLAPAYTLLLIGGSVLWEAVFSHRKLRRWARPWATLYAVAAVVWVAALFPREVPVLAPARYADYLRLTGQGVGRSEFFAVSTLPQFFADRFGWNDLAAEVKDLVGSLPSERRTNLGILCDNYGEASAINFFDQDPSNRNGVVPFAISPHNNYFVWGAHGYTGVNLLLVTARSETDLRKEYSSVTPVGRMNDPLAMPYERKTIYLATGRFRPLQQDWPAMRFYY